MTVSLALSIMALTISLIPVCFLVAETKYRSILGWVLLLLAPVVAFWLLSL